MPSSIVFADPHPTTASYVCVAVLHPSVKGGGGWNRFRSLANFLLKLYRVFCITAVPLCMLHGWLSGLLLPTAALQSRTASTLHHDPRVRPMGLRGVFFVARPDFASSRRPGALHRRQLPPGSEGNHGGALCCCTTIVESFPAKHKNTTQPTAATAWLLLRVCCVRRDPEGAGAALRGN